MENLTGIRSDAYDQEGQVQEVDKGENLGQAVFITRRFGVAI
jgi:hypothetical protein